MYDLNWARTVYRQFLLFNTRAEQINNCIRALAMESQFEAGRVLIGIVLTKSIASKGKGGRLWRDYKRLCKTTPLDKGLLTKVTKEIELGYGDIQAEKRELQLNIW